MRRAAAALVLCALGCGDGGGAADPVDAALVAPPDAAAPDAAAPPLPPAELARWLVGDEADAEVAPVGPGLILMGGGADVDAAFEWWRPRLAGGDVVVLRTSGEDGYNDYLYADIGGADSVETMLVTTRALADDAYVAWRLARAEGIFLAGGDQATYLAAWTGTSVQAELRAAWARGAVVGGTSAGCAVLGEIVFAAANGSVYSDEALADPYNPYMTLERDFLGAPPLAAIVTDTHFAERDRMGRLVAFMARATTDGWAAAPLGLGVDEGTALLVDAAGRGVVVGAGAVYAVTAAGPPATCVPGEPLAWDGLAIHELVAGDAIELPSGATDVAGRPLAAEGGALDPANPY